MKTKNYICNECKKSTIHKLKYISETNSSEAGDKLVYFSLQCLAIDCIKLRTSHMSKSLWDNLIEISETP